MLPPRILLIGLGAALLAAGTFLLWPRSSPARGRDRSALVPPRPIAGGRAPTVEPALARALPRPAFAAVHGQLRQLLEVQTGEDAARERLLQGLLAGLTDGNVAEILPTLSREELRSDFGAEALRRWLELDPAAASAWTATRNDAGAAEAALVARKLLEDPARLNSYCDQLPDGPFKEDLLLGAGLQVLAKDPGEAIALAERLGPGPGQTNILQTMAYDWTARDPDAALAWMMTVVDPAVREGLVAMGAKAIAVTDPEMAAEWLAEGVRSPALFQSTALALAEAWVIRSPADAAGWVAQLPAGESRQAAIDVVLRRWLATDPPAANGWILRLPERDEILKALQVAQSERAVPPIDP